MLIDHEKDIVLYNIHKHPTPLHLMSSNSRKHIVKNRQMGFEPNAQQKPRIAT